MKEDRHHRFMQREAKMRAVVRRAKHAEGPDLDAQGKDEINPCGIEEPAASGDTKAVGSSMTMGMAERKLPMVPRPMWALTEEQAETATEHVESAEADTLLDFANNLDFDKYISDSEVSALIENVRARIVELETSQDAEAKFELNSPDQLVKKSRMRLSAKSLGEVFNQSEVLNSTIEDDCVSVARSVLDSDAGKSVGAIHSQKSLAAIAERSRNATKDTIMTTNSTMHEDTVPQPVVIKHTEDAGARLEGKNCVSNLPYMHRNPAV